MYANASYVRAAHARKADDQRSTFTQAARIAADLAAEHALTGGYNTQRSNVCTVCFTARSVNTACNCALIA